ncbi:MAG: hypothetical protein ACYDBB_01470 [Armatimonadota bacterium]
MSYVIRNIHPTVLYLPDAGLRLESGQTAVVETLSPQMEELLANRALEAISSDPDPPVAAVPVEDAPMAADTSEPASPTSVDEVSVASSVDEPAVPVVTEKKTRKSGIPSAKPEQTDDTR